MSHYHRLSIKEREKILVLSIEGKSRYVISKEIGRSVSTVSGQLKRNRVFNQAYSAAEAQKKYQKRRKRRKRHRVLENVELKGIVMRLFPEQQWSPEQIANRLAYENHTLHISYHTIHRAIYAGLLDAKAQKRSEGDRYVIRNKSSQRIAVLPPSPTCPLAAGYK